MRDINVRNKMFLLLWLAIGLIIFSGCIPSAETQKKQPPTFFPPPPDLPRYQFLRSFNGSADFAKEASSALDAFIGVRGRHGFVFKKPYGVAMNHGSLYVCDTMNGVFKFDLIKQKFSPLKGGQGLGKLVEPINIAIDKQGNKYVCDPIRMQVIKYDKNDFYVKTYSNPDHWKPVGVAVYGANLFVVDGTHNKGRVQVFDIASGALVDSIGRAGPLNTQLRIPVNIAFDQDGYMYVVDMGRFQVVKYDRDGHYRGYLGSAGDGYGHFARPKGVAVDHDGRVYVVDAAFNNVQVFASNGQVLTAFGNLPLDRHGSMNLPSGICISYDNINLFQQYAVPGFEIEYLVVVANQIHPYSSINVYGFGRMQGEKYPSDRELRDKVIEELRRKGEGN